MSISELPGVGLVNGAAYFADPDTGYTSTSLRVVADELDVSLGFKLPSAAPSEPEPYRFHQIGKRAFLDDAGGYSANQLRAIAERMTPVVVRRGASPPRTAEQLRAIRLGCERCGYCSDIPRGYGVEADDTTEKLQNVMVLLVEWERRFPDEYATRKLREALTGVNP